MKVLRKSFVCLLFEGLVMAFMQNLPLSSLSTTANSYSSCKSDDVVLDQFPAGLRVLVVDDDTTCIMILEHMLRKCQYHGEFVLLLSFHFFLFLWSFIVDSKEFVIIHHSQLGSFNFFFVLSCFQSYILSK